MTAITEITVRVRYFASLREALGTGDEVTVDPAEVGDVDALRRRLAAQGGPYADALGEGRAVRAAVDRVMKDGAAPLHDGAEVAFFPPVTGG